MLIWDLKPALNEDGGNVKLTSDVVSFVHCCLTSYQYLVLDLVFLPPFSLIRDFGKQNTRETFPKFPSILRVIDRSGRSPPITAR